MKVRFMIGPKRENAEDAGNSLSVGNIVAFYGLQLDEALVAALFALGPGLLLQILDSG
jgi:hypothetical protein